MLHADDEDGTCLRSHRAYNVAKTGAQGVMIVAPRGTHSSELVVAPQVVSRSYTAEVETLELQHVNIPVGLISFGDGTPFLFGFRFPLTRLGTRAALGRAFQSFSILFEGQ